MAAHSLFEGPQDETPVVLSYDMGIDSTAALLRWPLEPACRDFDLDQLTVPTTMTDDEFRDTDRLASTPIVPRLGQARVRFVQLARNGPLE